MKTRHCLYPPALLLAATLIIASGCLEIISVNQPRYVAPGENFTVQVQFDAMEEDPAGNTQFGAIKLPVGFTVNSVTWEGNPLPEDPAFETMLTNDYPPEPGYYWWVGTTSSGDPIAGVATVDVTAGQTVGEYLIDYRVGIYSTPTITYEDAELDAPLGVSGDTDGDGMPDWWEDIYACVDGATDDAGADPDGDTISNLDEYLGATDPCVAEDNDGDGMPDVWENVYGCMQPNTVDDATDYDNDYWTNLTEFSASTDPCVAEDTEADGMPDGWEEYYFCVDGSTDDAALDPDSDTVSNLDEYLGGTDPCFDNDADGDGMPDLWENSYPCMQANTVDHALDYDSDTLTNLAEYQGGTDPCVVNDTDGDGMPDHWEDLYGCVDRLVGDSTLDPDSDTLANLGEYQSGTDPCVVNDADVDGMPDFWEDLYGCMQANTADSALDYDNDYWSNLDEYNNLTDPCVLEDTDGDGMPDGWEDMFSSCGLDRLSGDSTADAEGDGVSNLAEYNLGTDPCNPDSDGDGLTDGEEITPGADGFITDPLDPDTDGDGVNDGAEVAAGAHPVDPSITPVPETVKIGPDLRINSASDEPDSSLAWTGSEFAMAWSDDVNDLYFTRISFDGDTIGPDILIDGFCQECFPSLVWTGSEFGMFADNYFTRISSEGNEIGDMPVWVGFWASLAWTGSEFGLASLRSTGINSYDVFISRISASGSQIGGSTRFSWSGFSAFPPALAWTGSEFGLTYEVGSIMPPPPDGLFFNRVSASGAKIGGDVVLSNNCNGTVPSLAWTGSEFGVGTYDIDGVYFRRISSAGSDIGSIINISSNYGYSVSLVWTGHEFGMGWRKGVSFTSISADASQVGPEIFVGDGDYPSLAWAGSLYGVSWAHDVGDYIYDIYFSRILSKDTDGDGLVQALEENTCADPHDYDTDDDGIADGIEDVNKNGAVDAGETDPCDPDTDGDGLDDGDEINVHGTDPANFDTDSDGADDGWELTYSGCGLDPLVGDSTDDADTDGLSNLGEYQNGADPCNPDTDGDGLSDGQEVNTYGTSPTGWDTDGDYLPDNYEADHMGDATPLDPINPADGPLDFESPGWEDGNPNFHEFWNGSDPWGGDPAPNRFLNPACYFWADGDGDGVVGPGDLNMLELEVAGVAQVYDDVIPTNVFDTMDLDKDGVPGPGDISMLEMMITGADRPAGYDSSPTGLSVAYAPGVAVAVGATTHVTISVDNAALAVQNSGAFAVVFSIDPASTGDAVLLGGDGEDLAQAFTNRYDVSNLSTAGGLANIVLKITAPGPITINAKIPACGTEPEGRWATEVVLNPPVVIVGE